MKRQSTATLYSVTRMFADLLPIRGDEEILFGQLVRSISHCDTCGSKRWSIALLDGGFSLTIGGAEAMMVFTYPHSPRAASRGSPRRQLVLVRMLLAGEEVDGMRKDIALGSHIEAHQLAGFSAPLWRYEGSFLASSEHGPDESKAALARDLRLVAPAHRRLIELACDPPEGCVSRSSRGGQSDSEAVYRYGWRVCGVRYSRKLGCPEAKPAAARLLARA